MQVLGSRCSSTACCRSGRPAAAGGPQQQPQQSTRRPLQVRLAAAAEAGSTTTKGINSFTTTTTAAPAAATATASQSAANSTSPPERTEAWSACMQRLQDMGISEQQAELFVQRAFGWGAKARSYWRHEKREQPADVQQLDAALEFLRQLGMSEDEVCRVVKVFPEVLGCDVQQQLQGNVAQLQKDWNLQGSVLVKAVMRQPALLGYNVDCMGDCAGECNRCWVRF